MSAYFKYHKLSGHIDSKLVVIDDADLASHETDGYAFMPCGEQGLGMIYIDPTDGSIKDREVIENLGGKFSMAVGEPIRLNDLPECWISFNGGHPMLVDDGELAVAKHSEGKLILSFVGRYTGTPWDCSWSELESMKRSIKDQIDTEAEFHRGNDVTIGAGQAVTYLRKADAARALLAGQSLSGEQLGRIQDEANRLGKTLNEAAQFIVDTADAWEARDRAIDKIRLDAKAMINVAETGEEVEAIYRAIIWVQ